MKKFFKFLFSFMLATPMVFALTACGPKERPPQDVEGKISEGQWKELIYENQFQIEYGGYFIKHQLTEIDKYSISYYNGDYCIYDETLNFLDYNGYNKYYYKNTNAGNNTYEIVVGKWNNGCEWNTQAVDATEYESNISDIVSILNFIENNQSKFSTETDERGKMFYKLAIANSEIENNILNIKTQMRLTQYNIDNIEVENWGDNEYPNIVITLKENNNDIIFVRFDNVKFFKDNYERMFNGLTNYTITGGPSQTHIDYVEMKIADNGMFFSNPNAENNFETNYYKEFYTKDNGDGTYSRYIPTENGGWEEQNYPENIYTSNLNDTINLYLGGVNKDKFSYFNWLDGKAVMRLEEITVQKGRFTYTYSNYEITINNKYEIVSMTWEMVLHDSLYDTDSEIYNMTLTAGNTTIEYPQA